MPRWGVHPEDSPVGLHRETDGGVRASGEVTRHRYGLALLPGLGRDSLLAKGRIPVPVVLVEGVVPAPLVPVVPHVPVVLEGTCYGIHPLVASGACGVVHRRVARVLQHLRIHRPQFRLLHVEAEEVVVRPPRPRPVHVRDGRRVALQKRFRIEYSRVRIVHPQVLGVAVDSQADFGGGPFEAISLEVVASVLRWPELVNVLRIVELGPRVVRFGRLWICHHVVRLHDFRVRQFLVRDMGDEFEGGTGGAVLHAQIPFALYSVIFLAVALGHRLQQTVVLVVKMDPVRTIDNQLRLPVGQQPVVGARDQEPVEPAPVARLVFGAMHQAPDRQPQVVVCSAFDGRIFVIRRNPPREHDCRPPQRPPRRLERHAFEKINGDELFDLRTQQLQEPLESPGTPRCPRAPPPRPCDRAPP